jgi:DNA-binding phage protein
MSKDLQQVGIKQAVKIGMATEKMTMEEVARATGREVSTLSGMLSRGTPSLKSTLGVLHGVSAKLIVQYDNGQEVELVID